MRLIHRAGLATLVICTLHIPREFELAANVKVDGGECKRAAQEKHVEKWRIWINPTGLTFANSIIRHLVWIRPQQIFLRVNALYCTLEPVNNLSNKCPRDSNKNLHLRYKLLYEITKIRVIAQHKISLNNENFIFVYIFLPSLLTHLLNTVVLELFCTLTPN